MTLDGSVRTDDNCARRAPWPAIPLPQSGPGERDELRRWICVAGAREERRGLSEDGSQGREDLDRTRRTAGNGMRGRRREAGQAHVLSAGGEAQGRRSRVLFLDHL